MKLYHCPPTRSQRALWALREAGADFDEVHVNLFQGEQNEPAYRAVHPLGVVPALETDDGLIVESAAIAMWAAERYLEAGLAPASEAAERGAYLQWCVYGPAELDPYLVTITQNTMLLPEDQRDASKVAKAKEQLAPRWKLIEDALADRDTLVGDRFSAADISVGHGCAWAQMVGALADNPRIQAYLEALSKRPAYQQTYGT